MNYEIRVRLYRSLAVVSGLYNFSSLSIFHWQPYNGSDSIFPLLFGRIILKDTAGCIKGSIKFPFII